MMTRRGIFTSLALIFGIAGSAEVAQAGGGAPQYQFDETRQFDEIDINLVIRVYKADGMGEPRLDRSGHAVTFDIGVTPTSGRHAGRNLLLMSSRRLMQIRVSGDEGGRYELRRRLTFARGYGAQSLNDVSLLLDANMPGGYTRCSHHFGAGFDSGNGQSFERSVNLLPPSGSDVISGRTFRVQGLNADGDVAIDPRNVVRTVLRVRGVLVLVLRNRRGGCTLDDERRQQEENDAFLQEQRASIDLQDFIRRRAPGRRPGEDVLPLEIDLPRERRSGGSRVEMQV